MKPDYKRMNKIAIRNFSKACDFHDLVKTLLVKIIRRNHANYHNCYIYTESGFEHENQYYPDIEVLLKERYDRPFNRVIFEIQDKVTKQWTKKMKKRFEGIDWKPIPLKEVMDRWENRVMSNLTVNKKFDPVSDLTTILEEYAI